MFSLSVFLLFCWQDFARHGCPCVEMCVDWVGRVWASVLLMRSPELTPFKPDYIPYSSIHPPLLYDSPLGRISTNNKHFDHRQTDKTVQPDSRIHPLPLEAPLPTHTIVVHSLYIHIQRQFADVVTPVSANITSYTTRFTQ